MAYKVLLVEDDKQIREIICDMIPALSHGEIEIIPAEDGEEGLNLFYENVIDLVLLDVMLPGMNGFEICRDMRKENVVPIIFLTARGREEDILKGYACGCDDYVIKPFSFAQLHAKIRALLKRAKGMVLTEKIECGKISLDPVRLEVFADGKKIMLAPKEYALLKLLMDNKGCVVSRDTLLAKVWGYEYEGTERVVDNHIKKLRKALGPCGKQIQTKVTKGYCLAE